MPKDCFPRDRAPFWPLRPRIRVGSPALPSHASRKPLSDGEAREVPCRVASQTPPGSGAHSRSKARAEAPANVPALHGVHLTAPLSSAIPPTHLRAGQRAGGRERSGVCVGEKATQGSKREGKKDKGGSARLSTHTV